MSIVALHPNNKNQYRKYPLKQGSSLQAVTGQTVPDAVMVNCSLTSVYGAHRIYVKQLARRGSNLHLTVASVLDNKVLGVFAGQVKADYTVLTLTPIERNVSGTLTLGPLEGVMNLPELLNFEPVAAEFEESTIFLFTAPALSSVSDQRARKLTGKVSFGTLTNLTVEPVGNACQLTCTNPAAVINTGDKSSYLGNCPTPMILSVAGATPSPSLGNPANNGNVYIVGVKPVVFYGTTTPGVVQVDTENMTLDTLCASRAKVLPPISLDGFTLNAEEYKDLYYNKSELPPYPSGTPGYPLARPARVASNFNAAKVPEYYYWPQFVQPAYYNYWPTP